MKNVFYVCPQRDFAKKRLDFDMPNRLTCPIDKLSSLLDIYAVTIHFALPLKQRPWSARVDFGECELRTAHDSSPLSDMGSTVICRYFTVKTHFEGLLHAVYHRSIRSNPTQHTYTAAARGLAINIMIGRIALARTAFRRNIRQTTCARA